MTQESTGGEPKDPVLDREMALELSQEAQEEITTLFNMAIDLLCSFGFDSYFRRLNPAFERTLGFSIQELTSKPFFEFVHPEDVAATKAAAEMTYATGLPKFAFENRFRCRDGSYRWISWAAMPVKDEQIVYSVGRDVTELKRAQEELAKAKQELESRVQERTAELSQANELLQQQIEDRKRAHEALEESEQELRAQTEKLHEVNLALHVMLKRREEDQAEIEERILYQIGELVTPYLARLQKSGPNPRQSAYVEIMETNLKEITSSFARRLSIEFSHLTPAEMQIANLIRQGRSSKEIAALLDLSIRTVETHRSNIRKKLGIKNKTAHLRSHLLQFATT